MIKYSIKCDDCKFIFDSWFASSEEFERIKKSKLLICSSCNSLNVNKSLMTPNLNKTKKNQDIINNEKMEKFKEIKKNLNKYQNFIEKNYNYVGNNFAYEARNIHYNKDKKNIRNGIFGKATKKEIKELKDEGIDTETIPWINNKEN